MFWAFIILTHPSVLQELDFIIYTRGGGSWYFRSRSRGGLANFTPIARMGHLISEPKFKIPTHPLTPPPPPVPANFWQVPNRNEKYLANYSTAVLLFIKLNYCMPQLTILDNSWFFLRTLCSSCRALTHLTRSFSLSVSISCVSDSPGGFIWDAVTCGTKKAFFTVL